MFWTSQKPPPEDDDENAQKDQAHPVELVPHALPFVVQDFLQKRFDHFHGRKRRRLGRRQVFAGLEVFHLGIGVD
ncbi:MAG: hypothetical protein HY343_03360 [Lentisphaerae bacterium]|nr:hypothetical protein [Lentisphaerota bacterium]